MRLCLHHVHSPDHVCMHNSGTVKHRPQRALRQRNRTVGLGEMRLPQGMRWYCMGGMKERDAQPQMLCGGGLSEEVEIADRGEGVRRNGEGVRRNGEGVRRNGEGGYEGRLCEGVW
jgi:hypothetical protein